MRRYVLSGAVCAAFAAVSFYTTLLPAPVNCHKNEPADPVSEPCIECIEESGVYYQCDDTLTMQDQDCTDPTAEDGVMCNKSYTLCGGRKYRHGANDDCDAANPLDVDACGQRWWDAGNTPICPVP